MTRLRVIPLWLKRFLRPQCTSLWRQQANGIALEWHG
jgi:hypothetical protein